MYTSPCCTRSVGFFAVAGASIIRSGYRLTGAGMLPELLDECGDRSSDAVEVGRRRETPAGGEDRIPQPFGLIGGHRSLRETRLGVDPRCGGGGQEERGLDAVDRTGGPASGEPAMRAVCGSEL